MTAPGTARGSKKIEKKNKCNLMIWIWLHQQNFAYASALISLLFKTLREHDN